MNKIIWLLKYFKVIKLIDFVRLKKRNGIFWKWHIV